MRLTNGHTIYRVLAEHGPWVWVMPVDVVADDQGRTPFLFRDGPLTFKRADLDLMQEAS